MQRLGCIRGRGLELVITFGTGVGLVIFVDGKRIHMELGHHPLHKGEDLRGRARKSRAFEERQEEMEQARDGGQSLGQSPIAIHPHAASHDGAPLPMCCFGDVLTPLARLR